jgi:hypothetical protein
MFELMEETHDKLKSGQLISSRGVKHSAALLPTVSVRRMKTQDAKNVFEKRVYFIYNPFLFLFMYEE